MGYSCAIHVNTYMQHQVDFAKAVRSGFKRHGISCVITDNPNTAAEKHVVIGPHFAFNKWQFDKTLMLDRAYWGDPECVSAHWLYGGEKRFTRFNDYRPHPQGESYKIGNREIYLADYGDTWGSICTDAAVRYHPAQSTPERSLAEDLALHDIAVGHKTTALIDAALAGLMIESSYYSAVNGLRCEAARDEWLNDLAWHNWAKGDIESGAMLDAIGTDY